MKNILDKQLYNNSKYSFIVNSTCYHDLCLLLNDLINSLSINYWSDYSIIIRQKPNIYSNIRSIFSSFKYQLLDDVSKIVFVMNNPLHSQLSYLDIFISEINKDENVNIKNEILNLQCNLNVEIFDYINNVSQRITWSRLQSLLINNSPVYLYRYLYCCFSLFFSLFLSFLFSFSILFLSSFYSYCFFLFIFSFYLFIYII